MSRAVVGGKTGEQKGSRLAENQVQWPATSGMVGFLTEMIGQFLIACVEQGIMQGKVTVFATVRVSSRK